MAANIFSSKRLIPGRIRSKDFSHEEVRVLVYNFVKYNSILSNKSITDSNLREKNRLYVQITAEVNEVGGQNRREDAIKDKWQNEKRRVRFKAMKLVEKQKQSLLEKGDIQSKNEIITLTDDIISKNMTEEEAWVLSVMPVEYYQPDYVSNSQENNFFSFENNDQSQLSLSSNHRETQNLHDDANLEIADNGHKSTFSPKTVIKLSDSPVSIQSNSADKIDNFPANSRENDLQTSLNLNCASLGRLATLFTLPLNSKPFDSLPTSSNHLLNDPVVQDFSMRSAAKDNSRSNTKIKFINGESLSKRRLKIEEEKFMLMKREFHFKRKYYFTKTKYLNALLLKESVNDRTLKIEEQKLRLMEQEANYKKDYYEAKTNYFRSITKTSDKDPPSEINNDCSPCQKIE